MDGVDGKWECVVETPMGRQDFVLTVLSDGDRFSGSASGGVGAMDIPDGTVDGDTIGWAMGIKKPMPVQLTCNATITGDTLEGKVKAGFLGSFPITGTRIA